MKAAYPFMLTKSKLKVMTVWYGHYMENKLQWELLSKVKTQSSGQSSQVSSGKEINERVTMRRAFYTSPPEESWRPSDWQKPSENIGNRGWGSFLTHDLLFYKEWNYVYEDTMLFSFR